MSLRAVLYTQKLKEVYHTNRNESGVEHTVERRYGNFEIGFHICRVQRNVNDDNIDLEGFWRGCDIEYCSVYYSGDWDIGDLSESEIFEILIKKIWGFELYERSPEMRRLQKFWKLQYFWSLDFFLIFGQIGTFQRWRILGKWLGVSLWWVCKSFNLKKKFLSFDFFPYWYLQNQQYKQVS